MGWKPGSTKRSYDGNEPLQGAYTRVSMGLGILTKNTGHLRGPAALSESCDVVYHASRANITSNPEIIQGTFWVHSVTLSQSAEVCKVEGAARWLLSKTLALTPTTHAISARITFTFTPYAAVSWAVSRDLGWVCSGEGRSAYLRHSQCD